MRRSDFPLFARAANRFSVRKHGNLFSRISLYAFLLHSVLKDNNFAYFIALFDWRGYAFVRQKFKSVFRFIADFIKTSYPF